MTKKVSSIENEKLAELFRKYSDDVFRLAFSYVGSRPDAEDGELTGFFEAWIPYETES